MFIPNHITARLKMLRHRQTRGFGAFRHKILIHWTAVLVLAVILFGIASAYSAYTFLYWYNIESKSSGSGEVVYDQSKVNNIFRKFDEKALLTEQLLNEVVIFPTEVATSTATSTESEILEE